MGLPFRMSSLLGVIVTDLETLFMNINMNGKLQIDSEVNFTKSYD